MFFKILSSVHILSIREPVHTLVSRVDYHVPEAELCGRPRVSPECREQSLTRVQRAESLEVPLVAHSPPPGLKCQKGAWKCKNVDAVRHRACASSAPRARFYATAAASLCATRLVLESPSASARVRRRHESSNPAPASTAYMRRSRSVSGESYGGSLSRFMHVAAVGSRPSWSVALCTQNGGVR